METVTVGAREIRAAVPMAEAIDAVRDAFADFAAGAFEMPTRTALRDGQFLVMPVHHRPTASAMIKSLSLNFERRPAIAGTVVWSETGRLDHLIADAGAVTALRTGAIVGVATDLLAPPEAGRLTLIGAGAQAAGQVRAVHSVRPLRRLTVVDRHPDRVEALLAELKPDLGDAEFRTATDADEAVRDAEIICCATTATEPLFAENSLPERVHVNAIGAYRPTMRELPDELLASATVVIDELAAILEESGEIIHALDAGAVTRDDLTELGAALTGGLPARNAPRTVFKTVGVAVQDWAIAHVLARKFLP
jgi:ornithine cyclodeaminase/alanine dehydrogenase-like protein (mu-crystallin family)